MGWCLEATFRQSKAMLSAPFALRLNHHSPVALTLKYYKWTGPNRKHLGGLTGHRLISCLVWPLEVGREATERKTKLCPTCLSLFCADAMHAMTQVRKHITWVRRACLQQLATGDMLMATGPTVSSMLAPRVSSMAWLCCSLWDLCCQAALFHHCSS